MLKLLMDVGNSTCKCAEYGDGVDNLRVHSLALTGDGDAVSHLPAGVGASVSSIVVASVRSEDFNKQLSMALVARFGVQPVFVTARRTACGVTTAYRQATRLGADRFMALLGAWNECRSACIVVDCGTAVTIDAVNGNGVHQGGVIMPGLGLLEKALYRGTDLLSPAGDTQSDASRTLFARDTASAILEGCLEMFAGAVVATVRKMQTRLAVAATLFVTGGDSEKLLEETRMAARHHPHLVLEGLAVFSDQVHSSG